MLPKFYSPSEVNQKLKDYLSDNLESGHLGLWCVGLLLREGVWFCALDWKVFGPEFVEDCAIANSIEEVIDCARLINRTETNVLLVGKESRHRLCDRARWDEYLMQFTQPEGERGLILSRKDRKREVKLYGLKELGLTVEEHFYHFRKDEREPREPIRIAPWLEKRDESKAKWRHKTVLVPLELASDEYDYVSLALGGKQRSRLTKEIRKIVTQRLAEVADFYEAELIIPGMDNQSYRSKSGDRVNITLTYSQDCFLTDLANVNGVLKPSLIRSMIANDPYWQRVAIAA